LRGAEVVREDETKELLEREPGNPVFAELAAYLISQELLGEAILTCMRGLSVNPDCHKGRLILAHALFRSGFTPFAAKELQLLCKAFPDHKYLKNLLSRLDPTAAVDGPSGTTDSRGREVADIEFDVDALSDLPK
jgi:predicted Zn-dependent protease